MKNHSSFLSVAVIVILLIILSGCSESTHRDKKEVVLQINNSTFTQEEFNDLFKLAAYADPELELTSDSKDNFINYLIHKELLIQEAVKMKLDSKEEFVRTIEKYWESTLIRNLIEMKSKELEKQVLITDDQAKEYYNKNKDEFDLKFSKVKKRIKKIIKSKKIGAKLEKWTQALKEKADIEISKKLINNS